MIKKNTEKFAIILNIILILIISGCSTNNHPHSQARIYYHQQSGYANPYHKDSAPSGGFKDYLVKKLVKKRQVQSEYGNDPYMIDNMVYIPKISAKHFKQTGIASWYGTKFHKKYTSSKEKYDMYAMTAAHKTLPLPTYLKVVNLENHKSIIVKVNDRGPFVDNRVIDLSYAAANKLGFAKKGTAKVSIKSIPPYAFRNQGTPITQHNNVKSFTIQFAAFHKLANAKKYQATLKNAFYKHGVKYTPKITQEDELYILDGKVRSSSQYEKIKTLFKKARLTKPFISSINTNKI